MILILKHIGIEGPGSIADFLKDVAMPFTIIDLSIEKLCLGDLARVEAIISLGGPMNVYEEDKYPFLKDESELLKKAIKEGIPVLGVCLGAQLLAKACGAKVKKVETREIGWYWVDLTEAGKSDLLFNGLPGKLAVFQWHEDTFEIPQGAAHLVKSDACLNQAFRFGRNAYGLQFHVEVTADIIGLWIDEYMREVPENMSKKEEILKEMCKKQKDFQRQSELIYRNFTKIIKAA